METELRKKTVKQLKEQCKIEGRQVKSPMKKDDIIKLLLTEKKEELPKTKKNSKENLKKLKEEARKLGIRHGKYNLRNMDELREEIANVDLSTKVYHPAKDTYVSKECKTGKMIIKQELRKKKESISLKEKSKYFFEVFKPLIQKEFKEFDSLKTKKGDTQNAERVYMKIIMNILKTNKIEFNQAASQRTKDLQDVGPKMIDVEIKKSDKNKIMFNDTLPKEDVFYLVISTKYNKLLFLSGDEFTKESPWIKDYLEDLEKLKVKWCRGSNKKGLPGCMEVYARPNMSADITLFLNN